MKYCIFKDKIRRQLDNDPSIMTL